VIHSFAGLPSGCLAADIPVLIRWIGADQQEIVIGSDLAVTGAGRQDRDVAGLDHDLTALGSAEHQPGVTCDDAKDLMGGRVRTDTAPTLIMLTVTTMAKLRRSSMEIAPVHFGREGPDPAPLRSIAAPMTAMSDAVRYNVAAAIQPST